MLGVVAERLATRGLLIRARRGSAEASLRVLRAFAEAMAPGVTGCRRAGRDGPGAAGDVDVAWPLDRYLARCPPSRCSLARLGAARLRPAAVSLAVQPRQPRVAAGLPARVEGRGRRPRRAAALPQGAAGLGYGNDASVRAAIGYEITCGVDGDDSPPRRRAARRSAPSSREAAEDCDVVIVGSGAGGAVAATVLAEAGLDVVVLEAGPYMDRTTYPEEPLAALAALYRDGGLTIAQGRPAIPTPVGRAVGGTTVINSGTCFRAPEDVLAGWRAEHGIEWATELDPDYDPGRGDAARHAGRPRADGPKRADPSRGRRRARRQPPPAGAQRRTLLAVQLVPERMPARRQARRRTSPTCRARSRPAPGSGPASRSRGSSSRAAAPSGRAAARGSPGTRTARRSRPRHGPGRPLAARAQGRDRRRRRLRHPGAAAALGLSLPERELGRNLRIHPACWVGARFDDEVRGWDGVMQSYAVDEWQDHGILLEATFTPLAFGAQWLPAPAPPTRSGSSTTTASPRPACTSPTARPDGSGSTATARSRSPTTSPATTPASSPSGSPAQRSCSWPPGAREVYPQIAGVADDRRAGSPSSTPLPPRARRCASRRSTRWARPAWTRSRARRRRHGRRGPRRRGPLRRRRLAAAELDRRQPDDDHHRDGHRGLAEASSPSRLGTGRRTTTAARRRPSQRTWPVRRADAGGRRRRRGGGGVAAGRTGPPGRRTMCPRLASRPSRRRRFRPWRPVRGTPRFRGRHRRDRQRRSPAG